MPVDSDNIVESSNVEVNRNVSSVIEKATDVVFQNKIDSKIKEKNIAFYQSLISKNNSYNLVKHHLEHITRLDSIAFDANIVSETSMQKNWWNFTSSIFNEE